MGSVHVLLFIGVFFFGVKAQDWRAEVKQSAQNLSLNVDKFVEKVLGAKNLQVW